MPPIRKQPLCEIIFGQLRQVIASMNIEEINRDREKFLQHIMVSLEPELLVFALARPTATVTVPSNKATIILAMDVSRSMCSTDIEPNRLEAAKDAALKFVREDKSGRQIGIVAFAGFAELIQPPTDDLNLLESAINNLTTARRTAIGSAILRSIDSIAEVDERVAPTDINSTTEAPAPADEYVPHIIVHLTDGASNAGPPPAIAADEALTRGIRVYTIGFGTTHNSSPMNCGDQFQEFDPFGGGGGFGWQSVESHATSAFGQGWRC